MKRIIICVLLGFALIGSEKEQISANSSKVRVTEVAQQVKRSENKKVLKQLTAEDLELLSAKHGALRIDDFSPYMDLTPFEETGSLSGLLEFSYNGRPMCLRVTASDKDLAGAPYKGSLDHAVVFRKDFLGLDTMEEEYDYDGSCADIRSGNLDHILNGTVKMEDYIKADLPKGVSQSGFKHWLGACGGVYFLKDRKEKEATLENAGFFAGKASIGGIEIWENGEVVRNTKEIKKLKTKRIGQTTLRRGIYQTEHGVRWYAAYTEVEGSQISYCIYLNSKKYTEKEFMKMTKSIQLQKNAIY